MAYWFEGGRQLKNPKLGNHELDGYCYPKQEAYQIYMGVGVV